MKLELDRQITRGEPISPAAPLDQPRKRADWVDSAKGISICLVVLWHTAGTELAINTLLIFVRMPLFFLPLDFSLQRPPPETGRASSEKGVSIIIIYTPFG